MFKDKIKQIMSKYKVIKKLKKSKIHWELSDYDILNAIVYTRFEKKLDIRKLSPLGEFTNPEVFLCRYRGPTRSNPIIIQKFTISNSEIKTKCPSYCRWLSNQSNEQQPCTGHEVDDFIKNVKNHVKKLSEIRYRTLVPYEFVLCKKKLNDVNIYLVQNFLELYQIYYRLHGSIECFKIIIFDILNTLEFLNKHGLAHGCIDLKYCGTNNSTECVQFFEYSLTPLLRDMINNYTAREDDIQSLGKYIEELWSYMPNNEQSEIDMPGDLKDFIKECKSHSHLTVQELLKHPFMQKEPNFIINKNEYLRTDIKSKLKNEFEILEVIGKGAYGKVLKVKHLFDHNVYAVKRILLQNFEQSYKKSREVELLSKLTHENIVRYYTSWIEDAPSDYFNENDIVSSLPSCCTSTEGSKKRSSLRSIKNFLTPTLNTINSGSNSIEFKYDLDEEEEMLSNGSQTKWIFKIINIQMEFCENSTLRKAIDNNLYQDSNRSFRLLCQIVSGLSYIHGKGIIHRDLKPDNIFLNANDQIKIGDFGQATCVASKVMMMNYDFENITATQVGTTSNAVGTILYVAPEIMENLPKSNYDYKVDLYSLGVIYYEMCNPPFKTCMERIKIIQKLRDGKLDLPDADNNEIIKALVQKDPILRTITLEAYSYKAT